MSRQRFPSSARAAPVTDVRPVRSAPARSPRSGGCSGPGSSDSTVAALLATAYLADTLAATRARAVDFLLLARTGPAGRDRHGDRGRRRAERERLSRATDRWRRGHGPSTRGPSRRSGPPPRGWSASRCSSTRHATMTRTWRGRSGPRASDHAGRRAGRARVRPAPGRGPGVRAVHPPRRRHPGRAASRRGS